MSDEQKCIYDLVKIVSEQNAFIKNLNKEIDKLQKSNALYKKSIESQYVTLMQNNFVMSEERRKYDEFMLFLRTKFSDYFPTDSRNNVDDDIDETDSAGDGIEKSQTFITESGDMLVHKKMHPLDFAIYLINKLSKSNGYDADI